MKIDKFPVIRLFYIFYDFIFKYPTPSNLSNLWNFGFSSIIFLAIQIITGIFLSMHYLAGVDQAFLSVENIMRNINYGWLLRYLHANGASFFFFFFFFLFFFFFFFFSYLVPRRNVWNTGVIILLLMIITAFTGYVLPWGQMSFWAATVITNLFSAVPIFGQFIVNWLWGGFSVSGPTLNRFFSFHFILPFVILAVVAIHLILLHEKGSSNKLKISIYSDKIMFNPYYTIKDLSFILIILILYFFFVGFSPNYLGHPDNYIPADPLVTPAHIVPEWYFLPFYAMLRSIPSKIFGVIILALSIFILLFFPLFLFFSTFQPYYLLNWGLKKFQLFKYRWEESFKIYFTFLLNKYSIFFWLFVINCFLLGIIGGKPVEYPYLILGRISTFFYFYYFYYIIKGFNKFIIKDYLKNVL